MSRRGRAAAIASAVFGCAAMGYGAVTYAVLQGGRVTQWDQAVDTWIHARQTPVGDRVFVLASLLALPGAWIIGVLVGLLLIWMRRWLLLGAWILALGGGGLLSLALKTAVDRPRPPYASAFLHDHSTSFPSGHAMNACLCYGMLAYVVTKLVALDRARVAALYAAAAVIVLAVSVSRVYLAVHYPSDVVGGLLAATAWLAVSIGTVECATR
ncbi:MAG TPA: phosphatase PAP2 family protein [Gemmatimonadaceae bacterium]|nr:phosphatase PAP2 family protein [Gemmatimonadaceae bacterium]